jgi:hypothetical protein
VVVETNMETGVVDVDGVGEAAVSAVPHDSTNIDCLLPIGTKLVCDDVGVAHSEPPALPLFCIRSIT